MTAALALTILALAAWNVRLRHTVAAAETRAEHADDALADHLVQDEAAARYYDQALNTLRGEVARAEDERDAMTAAYLRLDAATRGDELATRRAAPKKRSPRKVAAVKSV
jgi:hypothetical protein